jgi:tape measure domain-containing protein
MTTLGQAYVQIMPSAKGISGSIQKTINPEATAAGKSAGSRIASSMASSMSSAGKTLTKAITVPALAATAAVGGIVSAFGWGRLKSVDSAQAQLRGLGYATEDVERISGQLAGALEGGMLTMGEATSAAATAMASGVSEGKELTRYIQILDGTVAGSTGTFEEMEQIFGRIVDQGNMTRNEFDMIAQRMPGFSKAVQDNMDISSDEMYEMLRNGEITTNQFLDIMEDFSGDMATEYAKSWEGMVQNTIAYIGILGENLLGGVFEQSKESIAEFIEFLSSDKVISWAQEAGQAIGDAFSSIVESVMNAIKWWTNLDGSTQKMILTIAGIAVAIGPVLLVASKLITTFMTIQGVIMKLMAPIATLIKTVGGITSPVMIVIGVITGLIALFTTLYQTNEGFRDLVQNVWTTIRETITTVIQTVTDFVMNVWGAMVEWWNQNNEQIFTKAQEIWSMITEIISTVVSGIVDFVMEIWSGLVLFWQEHGQMILEAAMNVWTVIQTVITTVVTAIWNIIQVAMDVIWGIMQFIWPAIQAIIMTTWEAIKGVIQGAIDVITGIIQFFSALFTGNWSALWDSVKQILSGAVQFLWNLVQLWFVGRIVKVGTNFIKLFTNLIRSGWNTIRNLFTSSVSAVRNVISTGFNFIRNTVNTVMNAIRSVISSIWNAIRSVISSVLNGIRSTVSSIWNGIRNTISTVVNGIRSTISSIFNSLRGIVSGAFNGVRNAVSSGIRGALNIVTNMGKNFLNAGRNIVTSIADGIKGAIGKVTDAISGVVGKVRGFLPFSPAKEGPLKDLDKLDFGGTISVGIEQGADEVQKAMDEMLAFDVSKKAKYHDPRYNYETKTYDSQQNQPIILQVDGKTFAQITGDYTSAEGGSRIRRIERGLA